MDRVRATLARNLSILYVKSQHITYYLIYFWVSVSEHVYLYAICSEPEIWKVRFESTRIMVGKAIMSGWSVRDLSVMGSYGFSRCNVQKKNSCLERLILICTTILTCRYYRCHSRKEKWKYELERVANLEGILVEVYNAVSLIQVCLTRYWSCCSFYYLPSMRTSFNNLTLLLPTQYSARRNHSPVHINLTR